MQRESAAPLTIAEMMEALLVFDEPILNSRYHGMLARYAEGPVRDELVTLPARVLESSRLARAAAERWMRGAAHLVDDEFLHWGERMLLDSFLSLIESEMRLLAYAARAAPTAEIRAELDATIRLHREMAVTLREALSQISHAGARRWHPVALRGVQEEDPAGDLRGQLETAVRASNDAGHVIRHITLSPTGLRHLRDQGCFQAGETTLLGAPVLVDFGWDVPAFAVSTFDAVPLEEIFRDSGERKEKEPR